VIVAELLTLALKKDNYDIDATGGGLWLSTTNYRVTVPANKRWFLIGGATFRDVSATLYISLRNSAGNELTRLDEVGAGTGYRVYPQSTQQIGQPYILDAGEDINMTFGVAQGVTAFATCIVLEIDL